MYGRTHSNEAKNSISKKNSGCKRNNKFKENLSNKNTGIGNPFYGKTHSEETKSKLRKAHKKIYTCPYCNKTGGRILKRWHFEHCKFK